MKARTASDTWTTNKKCKRRCLAKCFGAFQRDAHVESSLKGCQRTEPVGTHSAARYLPSAEQGTETQTDWCWAGGLK